MIFYIDGAKNLNTTEVVMMQFFNVETSEKLKFKQIHRCNRCEVICN